MHARASESALRRPAAHFRALILSFLAASCASAGNHAGTSPASSGAPRGARASTEHDLRYGTPNGAWTSSYEVPAAPPTLIRGATVMTAAGETIEGGDVLFVDGKIAAVGRNLDAPVGAEIVDASGRWVTPGLIDTHSHMGDYPDPSVAAHSDGNEATDPTTPQVWAEHSVWPQDPSFARALAGGVTTVQVLPGSANLIGGRGVTLKMVPSTSVQGMMFPGAPMAVKMACGENPKRFYQNRGPSTRMGNVAGYRAEFIRAQRYQREWDEWLEGDRESDPPARDLGLETLAEVLRGELYPHIHCYRADELVQMINLSHEFGFHIRAFHHGIEAYKVRDQLAADSIGAAVWYNWWGFKMEAFDAIPENLALLTEAGVTAILHTDDDMGVQLMNQDAARAMYAGRAAGIEVTRDQALRWITANPAWALGIADRTGTLEAGKNADVVIWSGDPFSVYSKADRVYIDGVLRLDRLRDDGMPRSDFELGILPGRAEPKGANR